MKKIDLAIYVGVITALISWGVSVEVRIAKEAEALNLSNRVRAMEELMLPMLIDWKTHVEVKKWQEENIKKVSGAVSKENPTKKPVPGDTSPEKMPRLQPVAYEGEVPDSVKKKVDKWSKGVFERQAADPSQSEALK